MKTENINGKRVLVPNANMWLYNQKHRVVSDKVYLGVEADESEWVEITFEEKQRYEALWNTETTDPNEATKEDLYNALAELGVE